MDSLRRKPRKIRMVTNYCDMNKRVYIDGKFVASIVACGDGSVMWCARAGKNITTSARLDLIRRWILAKTRV